MILNPALPRILKIGKSYVKTVSENIFNIQKSNLKIPWLSIYSIGNGDVMLKLVSNILVTLYFFVNVSILIGVNEFERKNGFQYIDLYSKK